ncbi:MAG: hypothetical protein ACLQU2_18860 [Candidatus Binataceae bacterium]
MHRAEVLKTITAAGQVLNVRMFGATGDNRALTVKVIAASHEVEVPSSAGFSPGESVVLVHAGSATSLKPPSGLLAQAMTYGRFYVVDRPGCLVDRVNPSCSTQWNFWVEAVDNRGGISSTSVQAVVSAGPAKPNPTNRIKLVWESVLDAVGYMVYGCSGHACKPALIAVLPNNWYLSPSEQPCAGCARPLYMVFWYMGHDFGADERLGKMVSASGAHQHLFTRVTGVHGNAISLVDAPMISGLAQMEHDDSPAFQRAIDRAKTTAGHGASIFIPPGQYPIGQTLTFYNTYLLHLFGQSAEGSLPSTSLVWHGAPGGTVFSLNGAREHLFEDFSVVDIPNGSTPGVMFDIDKYDVDRTLRVATTHDRFSDIGIGRSGIGVRIGNRSSGNCELMQFQDVMMSPYGGGWYGYYISGRGQTLDEKIQGGSIGPRQVAIYLNSAGSLDVDALDLNNNQIDWYVNGPVTHVIERGSDSEHAAHHLYVPFASTEPVRFAIYNSRFYDYTQTVASDDFYIVDNSSRGLELSGNSICGQGAPCRIFFSSGGTRAPAELLSVDNMYGTTQPFISPPDVRQALISVLDHGCAGPTGGKCEPVLISSQMDPAVAKLLLLHFRTQALPNGQ